MPKQKNLGIKIGASIFLAILLITFTNLGLKQFFPRPECESPLRCPVQQVEPIPIKECITIEDETCKENVNAHSRATFYILGIIGLIAIAFGLFVPNLIAQIAGTGTGFILIIEGMIQNRESTLTLFITAGILILIVIFMIMKFSRKR